MNHKVCAVCAHEMRHAFTGVALNKHKFDAVCCIKCGFLQIDEPHWLSEAYTEALAASDTGLVARNVDLSKQLTPLLYYLFGTNGAYVDFAGGTGLFVRLMRDIGFDYEWHDQYCENIHARSFEFHPGERKYSAVTAFEALEHIQNPVEFIRDALAQTKSELFIATTETYSGDPPAPSDWWYYAFEYGQHISFYKKTTLEALAQSCEMQLVTDGFIHIFCGANVYPQVKRYFESSFCRYLCRLKASRGLKSKTFVDHFSLVKSKSNANS